MKQKLFGFRGSITPSSVIKDLNEEGELNGISFFIKDGVFEAKYFNKSDEEKALLIANSFIITWNFRHNTKLTVNFNHFWGLKENSSVAHDLNLSDSVKITDKVITTHTITHRLSFEVKARIVGKSDSASFLANQSLVERSLKDESLKEALEFYSEEVIDEKRPLYGVYKALEVLINKLRVGGREKDGMEALGKLAGKNWKYVDEVKERTQLQRHAVTSARNILSEQQCRDRAKVLIESYADSI